MRFFDILAATLALTGASAHAGHDIAKQVEAHKAVRSQLKHRSLSHCADKIKRSGVEAQAIARRSSLADELMVKKGLVARDTNPLNTHHNPDLPFNLSTPITTIFGSNPSCLLAPETTEGPYYLAGELIRSNLVEDQPGVPLHLDLLVIDTSTCLPVQDAYVELWAANATGVYGGVSGKDNAPNDTPNARNSWLRGAQLLDAATGTVQFATIFPGHYGGRAPHVHVLVHQHLGAAGRTQPLGNGTLQDGVAVHTGQLFFDQDLIGEVEGREPYRGNTQQFVRNEEDYYVPLASAEGNDPFVSYVLLNGRDVEDGLLGWMTVGVDMAHAAKVHVAGTFHGK